MVLLGAVLLLSSTAAFESTDADRTASVTVPSSSIDSYLGMQELTYGRVACNVNANTPQQCVDAGSWQDVVDATNLFNEDFDAVEVEILNPGAHPLGLVDGETQTYEGGLYSYGLLQSDSHTTGLVCEEDWGAQGTSDVELGYSVSSPSASIEAEYVLRDVGHDCTGGNPEPGPGFQDVTSEDVDEAAGTQEFRFTPSQAIDNGGQVEIRLEDLNGLDYSGASVASVSGNHGATFDPTANTITWTAQGKVQTGDEQTILLQGVVVTDSSGGGGRAVFERLDTNETGEDYFGVN